MTICEIKDYSTAREVEDLSKNRCARGPDTVPSAGTRNLTGEALMEDRHRELPLRRTLAVWLSAQPISWMHVRTVQGPTALPASMVTHHVLHAVCLCAGEQNSRSCLAAVGGDDWLMLMCATNWFIY